MKIKNYLTAALCLCLSISGAQNSTDVLKERASFLSQSDKNIVFVENVYGSVEVQAYNGSEVLVEATRIVEAKNPEALQKAKEDIGVKAYSAENRIHIYLDGPYTRFDEKTGEFSYNETSRRGKWNIGLTNRRGYEYVLNFKIKVPRGVSVDVHNVNDGDVTIKDVDAQMIIAHNINGAVTLENIAGQVDVNALNEDITVSYAKNPTKESWFNSLNGDIHIRYNNTLDAEITHKSMNGDLYLDMDITNVSNRIKKTSERGKKGTKFKFNSKDLYKVGNGGVTLHFEQLNGDTIIKAK